MNNINEMTAAIAAITRLKYSVDAKNIIDLKILEDALFLAMKRIAELEARTLTVKLPKASRVKLVSGEYVRGWKAYDVTCAISNAGIKLQIEGMNEKGNA